LVLLSTDHERLGNMVTKRANDYTSFIEGAVGSDDVAPGVSETADGVRYVQLLKAVDEMRKVNPVYEPVNIPNSGP
jgi:hypothetical protein